MNEKIIVYDIGTSGAKSTLYDREGVVLSIAEQPYPTSYPNAGWHEQAPDDWWKAVVDCTHSLIADSGVDRNEIVCAAATGHYFGVVPIGRGGRLLRAKVPIWSDTRALEQGERFVEKVGGDLWYRITGRDSPASCTAARILWFAENEPEVHEHTWKYLPTKDYINYRLTGICRTEPSDASGSGIYSLEDGKYSDELLEAAGVESGLFPEIIPSSGIVGTLTEAAAFELGLPNTLQVVCGGGDTCCMALGAKGFENGRVHTSLGSSAFIALTADGIPDDRDLRPNIFAHVVPGMYVVTRNLHSAGNAFRWVRDTICTDLVHRAEIEDCDVYKLMTGLAEGVPIGANSLIFYPALAFGGPQDASIHTKGAFTGLDLRHNRNDLIRAAMEGIAMSLAWNLDDIRRIYPISGDMLLVGGGSESALWRQIFADLYDMPVIKTSIGQDAGTLGALALAAVGTGLWPGYEKINGLHVIEDRRIPVPENVGKYGQVMKIYKYVAACQAIIGDRLASMGLS